MYTIQHNPERHYILGEPVITIGQHKHTKILGLKDKRLIFYVQSGERGTLMGVVKSVSPNRNFISQLLVFSRKYMKQELINGIPPRFTHDFHPPQWIQSENFDQRILHFIKHQNRQNKSLLSW
jgi:hypothetical protein